MISMIASVGKNRELGKDNNLIWHIPDDMKFFKETTMGHVVIMGLNTYKSLPTKLKDRKMAVISDVEIDDNEIEVFKDIDSVIDKYGNSKQEVFIIGGASIYKQFIEYANRLYLTEIDDVCSKADTFFPRFNKKKWHRKTIYKGQYKDTKYNVIMYDRKTN